jgi:NADPH2:quinone reductase
MFTRAMFGTPDISRQHEILTRAANLIDRGELHTTLTDTLRPINATNLREAHRRLESGTTIGKLVLAGWG